MGVVSRSISVRPREASRVGIQSFKIKRSPGQHLMMSFGRSDGMVGLVMSNHSRSSE